MIPNHLPSTNSGIVNLGGQNHNSNVVGDGAHVDNRRIAPTPSAPAEGIENPKGSRHADVGVVTILPEEMRAVVDRFGLKRSERRDGLFFNTGTVETESGPLSVVAARTHSPGQRSTMSTLDHLRHHYSPRLWLLVGIGGGLDPVDARVGNVIVSTRIVYYDSRKIKADDVQRRGGGTGDPRAHGPRGQRLLHRPRLPRRHPGPDRRPPQADLRGAPRSRRIGRGRDRRPQRRRASLPEALQRQGVGGRHGVRRSEPVLAGELGEFLPQPGLGGGTGDLRQRRPGEERRPPRAGRVQRRARRPGTAPLPVLTGPPR
ncbi:hypothetical protein ABZY32_06805 [Nocardiopsis alba]|uniref:5'-methylthioadenosine/S-adenosylhomocysteine nucleosidase family protein n=1 Tax=Nocardiopsis alba TaxID=53437 RepID=UPI0033A45731